MNAALAVTAICVIMVLLVLACLFSNGTKNIIKKLNIHGKTIPIVIWLLSFVLLTAALRLIFPELPANDVLFWALCIELIASSIIDSLRD